MDLKIQIYFILLFCSLSCFELIYSIYIKRDGVIEFQKWFGSFGAGVIDRFLKVTVMTGIAFSFMAFFTTIISPIFYFPASSVWSWVVGFILLDFTFFYSHFLKHKVNILWVLHSVHHSEESVSLVTESRNTILDSLVSLVFLLPIIFIGIDIQITLVYYYFITYYQGLVHTPYFFKKNSFIDYLFITPAVHRIHHAKNPEYLDKNFGGTLSIWDVLFSTFRKRSVEPVYGIVDKVTSNNPILINTIPIYRFLMNFPPLFKWKEVFLYLFGSPGYIKKR